MRMSRATRVPALEGGRVLSPVDCEASQGGNNSSPVSLFSVTCTDDGASETNVVKSSGWILTDSRQAFLHPAQRFGTDKE
jgi:hypothetical protein